MTPFRILSGIFCIAVVACGAASSASNPEPKPHASSDEPAADTTPDGGWMSRCSAALPIRWYVYNTDHDNPEPLRDECVPLPEGCTSDAGLTDLRDMDAGSTCECVVAVTNAKNDAGHSSCPGNGPVNCYILDDRSLVVQCSPP